MTSLNRMGRVVRDKTPRPLPKAEPPPVKPTPLKLSARAAAAGAAGLTAIVAVIIGLASMHQSSAAAGPNVANSIRAYAAPAHERIPSAVDAAATARPAAEDLPDAVQAKSKSSSDDVIHVKGYYRKDGTYVHGYTRKK